MNPLTEKLEYFYKESENEMKWQTVNHDGGEGETKRMRVHNGWLIVNRWKTPEGFWLQSLHYFKDEKKEWKI